MFTQITLDSREKCRGWSAPKDGLSFYESTISAKMKKISAKFRVLIIAIDVNWTVHIASTT
jgi:hypothetical protein